MLLKPRFSVEQSFDDHTMSSSSVNRGANSATDRESLLGAQHEEDLQLQSTGTVAEDNSSSVSQEEHNNTAPCRWQIRERLHHCKDTTMAALKGWIKQETVVLVKLAIPITVTFFFQQSLVFVSLLCVGHISKGSLELDSAALAISFVNITGFSVGVGLSEAADTLCSQAYGYKNYKRVGVVFQRGILILGLALFPIWALWLNAESILLLVQQVPCVARLTARYLKIYCPVLPAMFLYIMIQKYLQAQSIVWPFALVGLLTNIVSATLHGILIFGAGLELMGAATALATANILTPVMMLLYVWVRKLHKQTWGGWNCESLQEWGQFAKLAIPGLFMICLEWWSAEAAAFVAGAISKTELAANAIWFQLVVILFMAPLGVSISISIRVGNLLGAGDPTGAKKSSCVAFGITTCLAVLFTIVLQSTKNYIGRIFTKDEAVVERVAQLTDVACVFMFSDLYGVFRRLEAFLELHDAYPTHMQLHESTSGAILRGAGRQYIGAITKVFSYCIIGLPVGITLALKTEWRTVGMWAGLAGGSIAQAIMYVIAILRMNWKKESQKAMQRAKVGGKDDGPHSSSRENILLQDNEFEMECKNGEQPSEILEQDNLSQGSEESLQLGEEETALTSKTADKDPVTYSTKDCCSVCHRSKLTLVLCRGSLLVVGMAIVIAAGISSQYYPSAAVTHGNYSECTETETSNSNFSETWSATYYSSLHMMPTPSPTPTTRTATSLHWTDSYSSSTHIPPSYMSTITMKFARTTVSSRDISPNIEPTPFI